LACRGPSPSYLVFLYEQLTLFKLKSLTKDRPHKVVQVFDFLDVFSQSDLVDQHLLCELYLHEHAFQTDRQFNIVPFVGDVQLRAFTSYVNNHVKWKNAFKSIHTNEEGCQLWIRVEL